MEISLTTIKKLSKSILNQMPFATLSDMTVALEKSDVLGFVIGVHRRFHRVAILKGGTDYAIVAILPWGAPSDLPWVECYSNGVTRSRKFPTVEARDIWFKTYSDVVEAALQTHIYL